jgi:hypothetical protein
VKRVIALVRVLNRLHERLLEQPHAVDQIGSVRAAEFGEIVADLDDIVG